MLTRGKKTFFIDANISGTFFVKAKTKEEALEAFKKMNIKHWRIQRINKIKSTGEIPF